MIVENTKRKYAELALDHDIFEDIIKTMRLDQRGHLEIHRYLGVSCETFETLKTKCKIRPM